MAALLGKLAFPTSTPGVPPMEVLSTMDSRRQNPLLRYFMMFVRKVKGWTFSINDILKEASAIVLALVVLGVCVMIAIGAYVFVFLVRPRPFMISHSAPFEKYMVAASEEISSTIHHLSASLRGESMSTILDMTNDYLQDMSTCSEVEVHGDDSLRSLSDSVSSQLQILSVRTELTADVVRYFQYHRSLASMSSPSEPNMLARLDFKSEAYFLSDITGEVDPLRVKEYYTNVYIPLRTVREAITKLSSRISLACGLEFSPDVSVTILNIHLLRLHLDTYHDQTTLSYETRKSGTGRLPTAVMTLYWWPEVESTYTKSVPNLWKATYNDYQEGLKTYQTAWNSLGEDIKDLPGKMSSLHAGKDNFTNNPSRKRKAVVIEGFSIGGLISGLLKIVTSVVPLFELLPEFIAHPFETTLKFLTMMLGLIIGLILYLIYMLLTITQVFWLPGLVYAFYVSYVYAFILSAVEIAFTMLLAIPYGILALLDMVTGGMVMHMLRCESLPSDWANVPFLAFENSRQRLAGLCVSPCSGERFAPSLGGTLCACLPSDVPPFCPQQQLFRAFREMSLGSPWIAEGFIPDASFYTLDQEGQQRQMALAYQRKTKFLGRCYSATSPYSFLTRHMCSDLANLLPHDTSDEVREQLTSLCHQAHCQFAPPLGDKPASHADDLSTSPDAIMSSKKPGIPFCNVQETMSQHPQAGDVTTRLGPAILLVTLAACMALVILYALLG